MFFWTSSDDAPSQQTTSSTGSPILTLATTAVIATLFVVSLFTTGSENASDNFGFQAGQIVYKFQIYRLITCGFIHSSFIHILINSIAFGLISTPMEKKIGSFLQFTLILRGMIVAPLILLILVFILSLVFGWGVGMESATFVGFSSVFFHLLTIKYGSFHNNKEPVSLYGLVDVPGYSLVWVLLVVSVVISPRSFGIVLVQHLSGIFSGYLTLSQEALFLETLRGWFRALEDRLDVLPEIAMFINTPSSSIASLCDGKEPTTNTAPSGQAYSLIDSNMI